MEHTCYLCGLAIAGETDSGDHVVPKHLRSRKQPKVKGFEYAGRLPTHAKCNNQFGPETYCAKALELIEVLIDENCVSTFQHRKDPTIVMMALNSDCLKGFSRRDLQFFKIIDVREKNRTEWASPSFFSDKSKTNPTRTALSVALAVLTKSAAALLVSRHLGKPPQRWRIIAIPYAGGTEALDFDHLLGDTKPFDIGVKVWLRRFETGEWFAIYRARNLLVYLLFRMSESEQIWRGVLAQFPDAEPLAFEAPRLTDLIGYEWRPA